MIARRLRTAGWLVAYSYATLQWRPFGALAATYRTVQVQVVHRHGDRTPITPLKDAAYWEKLLVPPEQLERIAQGTRVLREGKAFSHAAGGRGAFGKLTELGLLQMIRVGLNLKEALVESSEDPRNEEVASPLFDQKRRPLNKQQVRVFSTDFPRTIQSVQGLLMGLLDNGTEEEEEDEVVEIDVRHTRLMIPDPQPRATREQEVLEALAMRQPHVLEQEAAHQDLATRASLAIRPLLGEGAHEVAFGVMQEELHPEQMSIEQEPLAWNQLAEITKCLAVRDMLPAGLTEADVGAIGKHAAWRWFQTFGHERLAYLAMHEFVSRQVHYMADHANQPPLIIWSAHDSTLIGLLSAYRLRRPTVWPEYASVLMMEVVEITPDNSDDDREKKLAVRFSLNGERLASMWDRDHPLEMIPLDKLEEKIRTEGSTPSPLADQQEQ